MLFRQIIIYLQIIYSILSIFCFLFLYHQKLYKISYSSSQFFLRILNFIKYLSSVEVIIIFLDIL